MLLRLSLCSFPGGLSLECCSILEKPKPKPHIPSVYTLCEADADTAKSLMLSGLGLDAVLDGKQSAYGKTDYQGV